MTTDAVMVPGRTAVVALDGQQGPPGPAGATGPAGSGGASGMPSSLRFLSSAGAVAAWDQCGTVTSGSSGAVSVTFPVAFNTVPVGFSAAVVAAPSNGTVTFQLSAALTKTGFSGTVLQNTDGGDGSVSGLSGVAVYWTTRGS